MTEQEQLDGETLESFVERLNIAHYDVIYTLCNTVGKLAQRIQEGDALHKSSEYVSWCNKLTGEVQRYITIKKEHLLPYIHSLFKKDTDGDYCQNSTEKGCSAQHDLQLAGLDQSQLQLKDIISRIQMVALPLYPGIIHHDLYKLLQQQMALLGNGLSELLLLEKNYLIPKVTATQMNINTRD
ncbi:hypothetical protein CJD36_000855 [Flavipsychrobacter stenotrophus]|uniref:Uncharacterized protein n=1 Tax=Flavipsychrobacter stenotrophus TaxID=2077091 RepID=A0A2S7T0P6_9BACT|nr:hypothetical protein [Flavipsychrobacter stenotrophus]PQJ12336.1 hypothetical protein CJD36_000855 [Flavipsychrobacter stenotrophus]